MFREENNYYIRHFLKSKESSDRKKENTFLSKLDLKKINLYLDLFEEKKILKKYLLIQSFRKTDFYQDKELFQTDKTTDSLKHDIRDLSKLIRNSRQRSKLIDSIFQKRNIDKRKL